MRDDACGTYGYAPARLGGVLRTIAVVGRMDRYAAMRDALRSGELHAEPNERGERQISAEEHGRYRDEIAAFAQYVGGDEVMFLSSSYCRWIDAALPVADAETHLTHLRQRFAL